MSTYDPHALELVILRRNRGAGPYSTAARVPFGRAMASCPCFLRNGLPGACAGHFFQATRKALAAEHALNVGCGFAMALGMGLEFQKEAAP